MQKLPRLSQPRFVSLPILSHQHCISVRYTISTFMNGSPFSHNHHYARYSQLSHTYVPPSVSCHVPLNPSPLPTDQKQTTYDMHVKKKITMQYRTYARSSEYEVNPRKGGGVGCEMKMGQV